MEKMYKVYRVDTYFDCYAMEYKLVGAEDEEDLIRILDKIVDYKKRDVKRIIKEKEWRIKEIEGLFTDRPHEILDCYGYYE